MDEPESEICLHCKQRIFFGAVVKGEWAHWHGSYYCRDRNGFTATPLRTAQPTFHGAEDVL